MDDTRADRRSPKAIVRALGKVRRTVPEGLTGGQPDGASHNLHIERDSDDFVGVELAEFVSGSCIWGALRV